MNTNYQKGFVPLVAIIAIGIAVIAGGTAVTLSLKGEPEKNTDTTTKLVASSSVPVVQETANEAVTSLKATISSQAESSIASRTKSSPVASQTNTEDHSKSEIRLSDKSKDICDTVANEKIDSTKRSLTEDIRVLCESIQKGKYQNEDLAIAIQKLNEKWQLWLQVVSKQRQQEFERRDTPPIIETEEDIAERERVIKSLEDSNNQKISESYKESGEYPIILSFEDNLGNIYKQSTYNGYTGPYSGWTDESKRSIRVGDTISATVTANDPQGRTLEYNWDSNSRPFMDSVSIENGKHKYTSSNTLSYTITEDDLRSVGETFRLVWQIRVVGSDVYRFGQGGYDDTGFIDYKLSR